MINEPRVYIEPLIKIDELVEVTGISKFMWYRLAKGGKIPSYKCGRALRFKLSEILLWMKEGNDR